MAVSLATILLLLHVHAVSNARTDSDSDSCDVDWVSHGSSCFRVYQDRMNYTAAKGLCEMQNARVVQSKDQETNSFLEQMRNRFNRMLPTWIGLTRLRTVGEESKWVWEDGEPLEEIFNNWADNEPNDCCPNGKADCVRMESDTEAGYQNKWRDYSCTEKYGVICEKRRLMEQPTSTSSTTPEAASNMDNVVISTSSAIDISSPEATGRPLEKSTLALFTKPKMMLTTSTTVLADDAVSTHTPPSDSPVIASVNVSLTLTARRPVDRPSLKDSIRQSLEKQADEICDTKCEIGEIFLHNVTDTTRARKKRQAGDEVLINVIIQLIVLASQGGTSDMAGQMAEDLLQEKAAHLRRLARNGNLSVNIDGKVVRLVDNSDEGQKTPPWLIGVICAAVVVIIIIALVTVLLCRKKHKPGANMPTKNGNEMTNLDTPKRLDHPATDGSVDNTIYNTEDEGVVDNVIYNAGDDGTVDNVIYEGQDSQTKDRESAPESQYESVN